MTDCSGQDNGVIALMNPHVSVGHYGCLSIFEANGGSRNVSSEYAGSFCILSWEVGQTILHTECLQAIPFLLVCVYDHLCFETSLTISSYSRRRLKFRKSCTGCGKMFFPILTGYNLGASWDIEVLFSAGVASCYAICVIGISNQSSTHPGLILQIPSKSAEVYGGGFWNSEKSVRKIIFG